MDAWVQRAAAGDRAARSARARGARRACPRPRETCTAPRSARRSARRCCRPKPRSSGRRCSSPAHAPDLLATLRGSGSRRILLLGHVDTVVAHPHHKPLRRDGERLLGSGAVDMKGGVVLALGALRALTGRRGDFAEVALLLVCDEEWRTAPFAHAERFAGWDACLCFEAGELTPRGGRGRGRAAQGGRHDQACTRAAAPPTRARRRIAGATRCSRSPPPRRRSRPGTRRTGRDHLTAVPTVLHAGEAFNVVPGRGELSCDLRADSDARDPRRARVAPARDRRRRARAGADPALARDELGGGDGAAARPRERGARAPGRRASAAAAPATPATSPRRSR